jgi:hypothetical protein
VRASLAVLCCLLLCNADPIACLAHVLDHQLRTPLHTRAVRSVVPCISDELCNIRMRLM